MGEKHQNKHDPAEYEVGQTIEVQLKTSEVKAYNSGNFKSLSYTYRWYKATVCSYKLGDAPRADKDGRFKVRLDQTHEGDVSSLVGKKSLIQFVKKGTVNNLCPNNSCAFRKIRKNHKDKSTTAVLKQKKRVATFNPAPKFKKGCTEKECDKWNSRFGGTHKQCNAARKALKIKREAAEDSSAAAVLMCP